MRSRRNTPQGKSRHAMTLVELLVVVSIIVILMAVSIPLLRPAIKEGNLREASRQVNVFIASAKARSAQLGREAGIMIKRVDTGANAARELYIVESPLPYMGDIADDSLATMVDMSPKDGRVDYAQLSLASNSLLLTSVSIGDSIQFDFKGPRYRITGINQAGTNVNVSFAPHASSLHPGCDGAWGIAGVDDDGDMIVDNPTEAYTAGSDDGPHPPAADAQLPYQIFRQPTRSTSTPLQLAAGTCIDLMHSGMTADGLQFAAANNQPSGPLDPNPVVILFNPSGAISRVYYSVHSGSAANLEEFTATGTVYLLVGRLEQAAPPPPATSTAEQNNLQDPLSTWIAVAHRTGAVTVAENDSAGAASGDVSDGRSLARSGQTMGGR